MFQTEASPGSLGVSVRNPGEATKRRPWACEALTSKCEWLLMVFSVRALCWVAQGAVVKKIRCNLCCGRFHILVGERQK